MTTTTAPVGDGQQASPMRPIRARVLRRAGLLVGIIAVVFVVVLPQMVDYDAVAAALQTLTIDQLAALVVVTLAAYAAEAGPARVLIPAVSSPRAIAADIAGRAVVSTIPGPTDIATKFVLYRQWGVRAETAAAGIALAAFFEGVAVLVMPTIALVGVLLSGNATRPNILVLASAGVLIFAASVLLLVGIVRSERLARKVGELLDSLARRIWSAFRKRPPADIVGRVLRLRKHSKDILSRYGFAAFGASVVATLAWFLVLEAALWSVGLGPDLLPPSVVLTAMAVVLMMAMLPITPGAVGVTEVAYIAILSAVTGAGATDQITAAVMLFRIAQWLIPIPLGWLLLLHMRRGHWREMLGQGGTTGSTDGEEAPVSA